MTGPGTPCRLCDRPLRWGEVHVQRGDRLLCSGCVAAAFKVHSRALLAAMQDTPTHG